MDIKGHSAIVTGGGSGLGEATAVALAREGAHVFVLDLNAAAAESVASRIGGHALACDITSTEQIEEALRAVARIAGPARILANVAGIGGAARLINREGVPMPLADFRRQIDVNLVATFDVTRLAAAAMSTLEPLEDDERGVIVCTASVAAFEGQVGQAAYAAAKGGIASLTLPLARELSQYGIRVATIAPGLFSTPMMSRLPEKVQAALAESIPFPKRLGKPEEFAKLAAHIVSNTHINGEVIRLDGAVRLAPR